MEEVRNNHLQEQYELLAASYPVGIEAVRHQVLTGDEFRELIAYCADRFGYHRAYAAQSESDPAMVIGYSVAELDELQQINQWTWDDMMSFVDGWVEEQERLQRLRGL